MDKFSISGIIEVLFFITALVGVYVKLQVKMKEFEMKMIALEARMKHVEQQDEKIMEKLQEMNESLNEKLMDIKLELQTKQSK